MHLCFMLLSFSFFLDMRLPMMSRTGVSKKQEAAVELVVDFFFHYHLFFSFFFNIMSDGNNDSHGLNQRMGKVWI